MNNLFIDRKYHFCIFLAILFSLTGLTIFVYGSGFNEGVDFYFHNGRFKALMQAFQDGIFPSYIDYRGVYGYGYCQKLFYGDFALIPFALIGNITNVTFGYQSLYFTITVLCGVFMYNLVYKVYGSSFAASVAALIYTFSMYRMESLYFGFRLGEAISFTFVPLVFLGLYHIIKGDYKKWYLLSIGLSLMIMTHVLSTILIFIFVVILLVIYYKDMLREPRRIYYLVFSALATLLISAYYIYPFIEQSLSNTFYFRIYKTVPYNVCISRIDYIEILKSMTDGFVKRGMGPKLGFLLVFPLFFRFFIRNTNSNEKVRLRSADIAVIIGLFCIFLVSNFGPWDKFPLIYLSVIQFPWRLYESVCFFFAVAGGYYLSVVCKTFSRKIIVLGILLVLTSVSIVIGAEVYHDRNSGSNWINARKVLTEENHYIKAGMEYFPSKMPFPDPFIPDRKDSVISQMKETSVSGFVRNKYITAFNITTSVKDSLELPLIYYKGYAATLNGKEIPVTQSSHGLVQIPVGQSGRVEAWYKGTLVQKLDFYTTILSIFALCAYIFFQRRKKRE